jgi:transposase
VFRTVIVDNLKAVVIRSEGKASPELNSTFMEYSQARGFFVDPARVRHPQDKPRVERAVGYVSLSYEVPVAERVNLLTALCR